MMHTTMPAPAHILTPATATPQRAWRNWLRGLILLALTGLLMTLAYPGFYLWWLAPLCLVPFAVCILRRPMNWRWLLTYYLFGALWFTINLHWLSPVTFAGLLALCFLFMGFYWALFAWGFHRLVVQMRWPALLALPLTWVAAEYLRSTVLSGMPWFLLGTALAPKVVLIQIADLFGVWGVSFFAALTAGWLVDVLRLPLRQGPRFNPALKRLTLAYLLLAAGVVSYGWFRLLQHPTVPGPRVAVIQENIPQDQKDSPDLAAKRRIFDRHLELSRAAIAADPAHPPTLIVWPETMVPEPINQELLGIDDSTLREEGRSYLQFLRHLDRDLQNLSTSTGSYLLVGAPYFLPGPGRRDSIRRNTAVLYAPGHGQVPPFYSKRHLVPFGEYVPFKTSWPWLQRALLSLTPFGPDGDYSVTPGDAWTRFQIPSTPRPLDPSTPPLYSFGTPICYEDVMPYPSQAFVDPLNGHKQADFLISISNDGWYRSPDQLDQHLQMDQLRTVENRVPMARSVNSGNSGFVDSDGRVVQLVTQDGQSHFVAGFALRTMDLDPRVSLYSRIGDLFPILCGIVAALAVGWTIVRPRRGSDAHRAS